MRFPFLTPNSSDKQKRPVKLTLESLRAHDGIEKPRSPMKRFASSTDSYGRFATTGSSSRRGLDAERRLKEHQRGYFGGQGRGAESLKKFEKGLQRGAFGYNGRAAEPLKMEEKKKDSKQNDTRQNERQNNRDQDFLGRDGRWYRG